MARPSRPRIIDSSDEEDDSFPDLAELVRQKKELASRGPAKSPVDSKELSKAGKPANAPASVRRRRLGQISDNASLLGAWAPAGANGGATRGNTLFTAEEDEEENTPRRLRVQLRTRKSKPIGSNQPSASENQHSYISDQEEVTITEDVSIVGDAFGTPSSELSAFEDSLDDFIIDDDEDSAAEFIPSRPPPKPRFRLKGKMLDTEAAPGTTTAGEKKRAVVEKPKKSTITIIKAAEGDLTGPFSQLTL